MGMAFARNWQISFLMGWPSLSLGSTLAFILLWLSILDNCSRTPFLQSHTIFQFQSKFTHTVNNHSCAHTALYGTLLLCFCLTVHLKWAFVFSHTSSCSNKQAKFFWSVIWSWVSLFIIPLLCIYSSLSFFNTADQKFMILISST